MLCWVEVLVQYNTGYRAHGRVIITPVDTRIKTYRTHTRETGGAHGTGRTESLPIMIGLAWVNKHDLLEHQLSHFQCIRVTVHRAEVV